MRMIISLILLNVICFILQGIFGDMFTYSFSLVPALALSGAVWQFITYMFLHGGIFHLAAGVKTPQPDHVLTGGRLAGVFRLPGFTHLDGRVVGP